MSFAWWLHGPLSDHDIVLGHIPVYWAKRACGLLQLVSGVSALASLVTAPQKVSFYNKLIELKKSKIHLNDPMLPLVPKKNSTAGFWIGVISLLFGMAHAVFWVWIYPHASAHDWLFEFWSFFCITCVGTGLVVFTLWSILIPIAWVRMIAEIGVYRIVPMFSRFFSPDYFEKTILIASVCFFVLSSVCLLMLS